MGPRRRVIALAGAVAVVVVVAALVFQPWKLVLNVTVDEAAPATGTVVATADPFVTYEHETTGTARVIESDGARYLRLEDFATSNGPDVVVYLSSAPATGPEADFDRSPLHLGSLKGNRGDQNYALPPGTDLAQYRSIVIWCQRFHVAFAAAPLTLSA